MGYWYVNVFSVYAGGEKFTYHSPGDLSSEPLNQTWDGTSYTNLRLAKTVGLFGNVNAELFIDVNNVFDENRLRRPSGVDLEKYMENDELPINNATGEVEPWMLYDFRVLPREIWYGVRFEF